ncbi:MAG: ABC transporter permease [Oscillospiraceae bacterium]|nr:ABC transporter permease [Oscillospiraceae bacterium]
MLVYIGKRLLRSLISLFIIIVVVFCLLRMMPIEGYFPSFDKMTPLQVENGLRKMGLLDPVPVQLFNFFKQLLRGDLGTSMRYRQNYSITKIIANKAPFSIRFGMIAVGISIPLGLGLGVLMARKKGGLWDKFGTVYIVIMQAVPAALYYLFLQLYGTQALNISLLYNPDKLETMILPLISLALPSVAYYAMWMRRYAVDESNKDYIKLARAKGVPGAVIWFRHVFRNAVVPIVQLIPNSLLLTLAGSIYVESLYSIPGMGGLMVDVIKRQDNTMVQALVIVFAVLTIVGLLLGDIFMALVDPRISLTRKAEAR